MSVNRLESKFCRKRLEMSSREPSYLGRTLAAGLEGIASDRVYFSRGNWCYRVGEGRWYVRFGWRHISHFAGIVVDSG